MHNIVIDIIVIGSFYLKKHKLETYISMYRAALVSKKSIVANLI